MAAYSRMLYGLAITDTKCCARLDVDRAVIHNCEVAFAKRKGRVRGPAFLVVIADSGLPRPNPSAPSE